MALITFPSSVLVVRSDLGLAHPGQTVLRSIYGAGSQVLTRGPGHWAGRLEIAETDAGTDSQRRSAEVFLARLRGAENTFEVPIERPSGGTLAANTSLTASAASITSGELEITVSETEGLVAGDYVRIGDRLYQLINDQSDSKFKAEPPEKPAITDPAPSVVWEDVTCLARLLIQDRGSGLATSWTPEFGGPWVIDWEEAI